MKFDAKLIRTAALGFLAGAVIAGAAVFFTVSHLFRERSRETFELYNATLASARLAALQVLRDEGLESGIALLENALLNDLKALELDEVRVFGRLDLLPLVLPFHLRVDKNSSVHVFRNVCLDRFPQKSAPLFDLAFCPFRDHRSPLPEGRFHNPFLQLRRKCEQIFEQLLVTDDLCIQIDHHSTSTSSETFSVISR